MDQKTKDIGESMRVMNAIVTTIGYVLRGMEKFSVPTNRDEDLLFVLNNYLHILISSFMEEWRHFNGLVKKYPELIRPLQICSPAINKIKQWKEWDSNSAKFRNLFLAHNYRDRNGNPMSPFPLLSEGAAPTNYTEMMLLANCTILTINELKTFYNAELNSVLAATDTTLNDPRIGIQTNTELMQSINEIRKQMELQKKQT